MVATEPTTAGGRLNGIHQGSFSSSAPVVKRLDEDEDVDWEIEAKRKALLSSTLFSQQSRSMKKSSVKKQPLVIVRKKTQIAQTSPEIPCIRRR
jgi:hypothetical protein